MTETVHKSFFEVDEEMTKASAAAMKNEEFLDDDRERPRSRERLKKKRKREIVVVEQFSADRPFAFLVYHHQTQQILFLGKIIDPTHQGDNDKKRAANNLEETNSSRVNKKQK